MRYQSLKELKDAYESGELSKDIPLTLDNDSASVYVNQSGDDWTEVYEGGGPGLLLEEALDLLGIPHGHV